MKKVWNKWVRIVKVVIGIQSTIILFVIYYVLIIPMSIVLKIFSRKSLLGYKGTTKENSYWVTKEKIKQDYYWARTQ